MHPIQGFVHKDYADYVMNVFARANSSLLRKVKEEEPNMCEAIEELFADKIEMLTKKVESETKRADDAEKENKRLRAEMERMKAMIAAG